MADMFPDAGIAATGTVAARHDPRARGEADLLAALRDGDESAFTALVETHHAALMRLAIFYVGNRAVAEEVVQETWVGLLDSIERFEGRSTLKTWIFRILMNAARKRRVKEARTIPFSAAWSSESEPAEDAVEADRFLGPSHRWEGQWRTAPSDWRDMPEEQLLARETRERVAAAIERLPAAQREVITLRDVEGWSSQEVCNILGLNGTNARVLLHRARARVRKELESYLDRA